MQVRRESGQTGCPEKVLALMVTMVSTHSSLRLMKDLGGDLGDLAYIYPHKSLLRCIQRCRSQGPQGCESIHLHKMSGTEDSAQTKMEADGWVSRPQGRGQGQEGDS